MNKHEFTQATDSGKIFTVEFVKRTNGEVRTMNCRRGVTKGVTGKGLAFNPERRNLLVVYDLQQHDFRMINLRDIISLKMDGKNFYWAEAVQEFREF